ncbi:MAG: hypothetical protein WBV36_08755, partial [Terriglobales bacterium]
QLGQFDPGNNRGSYTLSLIRADDNKVIAVADLDMSQAHPDAIGFKYVRLTQPILLGVSARPVVIYPRGLQAAATYEVRASSARLRLYKTGAQLMSDGINLDKISGGEMIFLNLPNYPGSGTDHIPPSSTAHVTKRLGTNLGAEGIEVSWSPSHDDNWISYYEIHKNGRLVGKTAKGTFFFDHSDTARNEIAARFEVEAVDGDGNHSPTVTALSTTGEPQTYEALGDFSPTQSSRHWAYEELADDGTYKELVWDKGGYEGRWTGSGLGRIGRIWMQPSAANDLSRTFIAPASGTISTSGSIRKDPSAANGASCFVRILHNSIQVWPASGWAEVSADYDKPTSYALSNLHLAAGDKIRFILEHNGENRADPIVWDPVIVFHDSDSAR